MCVFFYLSKYCIDQEFDASYNSEMVLAKYDFDINGKTISNLLEQNEFVYFIPEFQRKVAWKAEFNQLLEDINEEFKNQLKSKIPLDRFGRPQDIANCAAFLSSDMSNYITGETIHVNGGMYFS